MNKKKKFTEVKFELGTFRLLHQLGYPSPLFSGLPITNNLCADYTEAMPPIAMNTIADAYSW